MMSIRSRGQLEIRVCQVSPTPTPTYNLQATRLNLCVGVIFDANQHGHFPEIRFFCFPNQILDPSMTSIGRIERQFESHFLKSKIFMKKVSRSYNRGHVPTKVMV